MVIDAVLSAHDSDLCGVTRFNKKLAAKMGVPHAAISTGRAPQGCSYPLVSIKPDEVRSWNTPPSDIVYALFLHGYDETMDDWVDGAQQVFVANPELATKVPGARVAWCPETMGNDPYPKFSSSEHILTVSTVGMAHKTQLDQHMMLASWLQEQRKPYWVLVSSGFHEGQDLNHDMKALTEGMRDVYGSRAIYLGFLSNAMTRAIMASSTMVACFFEKGIRQNNTTAMAAMRMGCPVVTTFDDWSPYGMIPGIHALDLETLPNYDAGLWQETGDAAKLFMSQWYTWEGLIEVLTMEEPRA